MTIRESARPTDSSSRRSSGRPSVSARARVGAAGEADLELAAALGQHDPDLAERLGVELDGDPAG